MSYEISELERMIDESREKINELKLEGYPVIRHVCLAPHSVNKAKIKRALDKSKDFLADVDEGFADRFGAELERFLGDPHPQYCPVVIEEKTKYCNRLLKMISPEYEEESYIRYMDRTIYGTGGNGKVIFEMRFFVYSACISDPNLRDNRPSRPCTA